MKKNTKFENLITKELKNKTILISGGAGSIGSALSERIIKYPIKSLRILDINEHSLFKLKRNIDSPKLRLLLGSVLDKERLDMASFGTDIIIHTAAVKNIEISEFNPMETIDVNINGTINMIKASIKNKPKKFLNISTDKAADSSTLYGTTKNVSEKLISWAGSHFEDTTFASARFGNVIETKGNVFEIWKDELEKNKPLSITHPDMTRYFFHIDEAVNFLLNCLIIMKNGELFIPKMKSFKVKELANKISKNHKIIGLRQGEKMNEVLISDEEKKLGKEHNDMWIVRLYNN
jgi:UDP-N-acetylglucosamine 4,6-dehydratase/5-epimerase